MRRVERERERDSVSDPNGAGVFYEGRWIFFFSFFQRGGRDMMIDFGRAGGLISSCVKYEILALKFFTFCVSSFNLEGGVLLEMHDFSRSNSRKFSIKLLGVGKCRSYKQEY